MGAWVNANVTVGDDNTDLKHLQRLYSDKRFLIRIVIISSNTLKNWEGMLSLQIAFERDGNGDKRTPKAKFFIRQPKLKRPFRSIGKHVIECDQNKL